MPTTSDGLALHDNIFCKIGIVEHIQFSFINYLLPHMTIPFMLAATLSVVLVFVMSVVELLQAVNVAKIIANKKRCLSKP